MKNGIDQNVVDETLKELADIEKSMTEEKGKGEGDLEALEKAAKEAEEKKKKEDEEEKARKEAGGEEVDDVDDLEKALQGELDQELVKASEAYASLEKSVTAGMSDLKGQVESLMKSVASVVKINIAQAKVIGALTKSVQDMGGLPVGGSRTHIGKGKQENNNELKKSISEAREALTKAVQDGKVRPDYLSISAVRGFKSLPDDVLEASGLKGFEIE